MTGQFARAQTEARAAGIDDKRTASGGNLLGRFTFFLSIFTYARRACARANV